MTFYAIVSTLRKHANPANIAGMTRFGINPDKTLGIAIPFLRSLAKTIGKDHALAGKLWQTGIHEARILAGFIDDPKEVTETQMEAWVQDFDSWDVCDQVCSGLFDKTPFAVAKARTWTARKEEFVKRAGYVLMAALAVHDKTLSDSVFTGTFFPLIEKGAIDERNFVKKAVNWALRQIGKRNAMLEPKAYALARKLAASEVRSARWVGSDAVREFDRRRAGR